MATKKEMKDQIEAILNNHNIDEELQREILQVFSSKTKTNRIIKEINGVEYKSCRFTGRLWKPEDLVYQNKDYEVKGKDKGYSKVGISLWNKGRRYIKELEAKVLDKLLSGEDATSEAEELKEIKEKNLGNSPEWLYQFTTEAQKEDIEIDSFELDIELN